MKPQRFEFLLRGAILLIASLLINPPVIAQWHRFAPNQDPSVGRAPLGYARPPIYVIGDAAQGPVGLTPQKARHAYGFDLITNQGAGQTIGIVDAYDDPNIGNDLATFSNNFNLPICTTSNGCFRKIYATGSKPLSNSGWSLEIALDVEWAHAIAPQAKIILVEASSTSFPSLMSAVDIAVQNGASVVSMSFGGTEFSTERNYDSHFSHNTVTFVASAGDNGTGNEYPAASPGVVAVGGTTLNLDSNGNYLSETAWSGSGGGLSLYEFEPLFQASFAIPNDPSGKRGVPDVAYDADPNTGFAIYDSVAYNGQTGWFQVGGTSAGVPQWAALFAIVNSLRAAAHKAPLGNTNTLLYSIAKTPVSSIVTVFYGTPKAAVASNFHDVTSGSNGPCIAVCSSSPGYDFITGLGSPRASVIIQTLASK